MPLIVDLDKNCAQLKIGKDIYLKILNKAITQSTGDMEELKRAVQETDLDTVQTLSHRLKGDYDNMRITEIAAVARTMNNLVKTGNVDQEELSRLFAELSEIFQELKFFADNLA